MTTPLNGSLSRTYVIPVYNGNFTSKSFRKFTLPEIDEHPAKNDILKSNTCGTATWWFYNVLDSFSCGDEAYPI